MIDIKNIAHLVKKILIQRPDTRDSDELLVLKVWCHQMPKLWKDGGLSFMQFGEIFKNKELASTESIRRSRQKLQQEFPELRGKYYKERNKNQEQVKEDLKAPEILGGGTP